ncbi:MAG: 3',5'-cyclic-nucleotide phosphodiesterase, partial [Acidobacteria bacterium]|nr:3',5'-cyclic-nucleotide phosphodiesterase [Acidobacteriota bacterium]
IEHRRFAPGEEFDVCHLKVRAVSVNHGVPSCGFLVSNGTSTIAITGDTATTDDFWPAINKAPKMSAVLIECAFPDELDYLATVSHHLTPATLAAELQKYGGNAPIFATNLKPVYREQIVKQILALGIRNLNVLEVGKVYDW